MTIIHCVLKQVDLTSGRAKNRCAGEQHLPDEIRKSAFKVTVKLPVARLPVMHV